ncbi:hypothetical protein JHD48_02670 [Sulfurimonas sp. SAG-AH-194-I05]|nr:hypothetical protein [Sulfurimonas sp. SAG-AH-194-I05]MDF1874634.1 hypothetical protein [Sulfurimonas sp. SAG-AH-194-I05]
MKYIILLLLSIQLLLSKDFSITINKEFNSALFDITQNYDRSLSAIGFSNVIENQGIDTSSYTNAFDYLSQRSKFYGPRMYLISLHPNGSIRDERTTTLANFKEAVSVLKTPNDGYYIGGNSINGTFIIQKLDAKGTSIFTKELGTKNNNTLTKLSLLKDGGLLCIGYSKTSRYPSDDLFQSGLGGNDTYIIRLNKNGKILWNKKFGTSDDDQGIDAVEADDGSLIILATTLTKNSSKITIMRLGENGNKLWLHTIERTNKLKAYKIIKLRDNSFVIALTQKNELNKEQIRLIKFNLQQDILLDKEIYTSYSSVLKDIKEYSNRNIIGVGYVQDMYNTDALVMIIDSEFNMLHQQHYGGENRDMFNAVSILNTSKAAVVGITTNENSQESKMWIVKIKEDATMSK